MICLLGSSFSRGAHGSDLDNHSTYVHNLIHRSLDIPVINLSISGHGSEIYTDAYVYACRRYKPRVIIAEMWYDRTYRWLWLPTASTNESGQQTIDEIYAGQFAEGYNDGLVQDNKQIWQHKIFGVPADSRERDYWQGIFKTSDLQHHDLPELLQMYETLAVYCDHVWPMTLRTIRRFMNLEALSQLVGVPVLWWTYLDKPMFRKFTDQLPVERHLNTWSGINSGVCEWAGQQLHGQHLADSVHLTTAANELVLSQLTIPWLQNWFDHHEA
jgi:hypothetical protein